MHIIGLADGNFITQVSADEMANLMGLASKGAMRKAAGDLQIGQQVLIHEMYANALLALNASKRFRDGAESLRVSANSLADLIELTDPEPIEPAVPE